MSAARTAASVETRTTVVNRRHEAFDVYIGRGSDWGNPFKIGVDGTREQVIDKYRIWIQTQTHLMARLSELKGKRLGCYCAPEPCHGDVLVDLLEERARREVDPRTLGAKCDICPLRNQRPVLPQPASGKLKLVVVGEAPGRMEEQHGIPFIGPSGRLLDSTLRENKLHRDEAHVTNTILCRPEAETDILPAQACCSRRLFRELKQLDAAVPIVALGGQAARALLGVRSILRSRGFIWQVPNIDAKAIAAAKKAREKARFARKPDTVANNTLKIARQRIAGRTVFPTLHPAFILRSEIWRPVFDVDMARVAKFVRGKNSIELEDEAPFTIAGSTRELRQALDKLKGDLTIDIETDGPDPLTARMICCGIGTPEHTVIAYPWKKKMAKVLTRALRGVKLIGHNVITFDCLALRRYDVHFTDDQVEDTMVAHHAFASHLPKSLAHVGSVFCDVSPWKQKAKGEGKSEKGLPHLLSPEDLTTYNAADVRVTALSWVRIQPDLLEEMRVYEITKKVARLCAKMREAGFPFDSGRARELSRILQARKTNLLWEMRDLVGDANFSPRKAFDIRNVLFRQLGVPLIYPTKSGLPATSRMVLEQLRSGKDKAGLLSDLILRWRDADKTKGTYLGVSVANDGRVHGDWRIGPQTGRLACRIMTLPRYVKDRKTNEVDATDRVRECYIAAPGYVLVYFDLSQAEMRFAANLANDRVFIENCKGDVHAGNARVLFPEAAKKGWLDGKEAKEGKGKVFRDIAKNVGFAITYLAEWETAYIYLTSHGFAVSPGDVRDMLDRLHIAYEVYFDYVKRNVAFVQKNGYLRTAQHGRIRWFGSFPKPTEVANYPVQGGIADMMNDRLIRLDGMLPPTCRIIAQIHDAAIIHTPVARVDEVKGMVREVYDPPVELPDRDPFLVPIDLKVAERWSEL